MLKVDVLVYEWYWVSGSIWILYIKIVLIVIFFPWDNQELGIGSFISLLWDSSPWVSHISVHFTRRGAEYLFFPDYLFNSLRRLGVLLQSRFAFCLGRYSISFWRQIAQYNELGFPLETKVRYTPPVIKHLNSLNSEHLYWNVAHSIHRSHLALFAMLYGNWGSGNWHKKMLIF